LDFEDSIHIATALENDIKWFLTYDGARLPQNREKPRKLLIPLDNVISAKSGKKLRILTPSDFIKEIQPLSLNDNTIT